MRGDRFYWFLTGFAFASLVFAVAWSPPVSAQDATHRAAPTFTGGPGDPIGVRGTFPPGSGAAGSSSATADTQTIDPRTGQPLDPNAGGQLNSGVLRPGLNPVVISGVTRSAHAAGGGAGRPVPRDGDLSYPAEPIAPRDGVIDVSPARGPQDGADPAMVDTRQPEDAAAFNSPAAGYDPLLFQIENIESANPRLNRLPRRLFEREPYDPVGVRVGSFVLFPEIETGFQWSSNVFASQSASADRSYELRPAARFVSNWASHALELRGAATLSTYDKFKTEDDRGFLLEARGRLDITRRTNLQVAIGREVAQESRSAIDASQAGDRANITVERLEMALNKRFNRLRVQLRGAIEDYAYGDVASSAGLISNQDRDFVETRQAVRTSWEFKPSFSVFGEVELIQRDFNQVAASDLLSRDAQGSRYRVGVDFGSTGNILRGSFSLGYGDHRPSESQLSGISGLIVDANLAWRVNGLTSVLLTARSDVTDTTTAGSSGVLDRQVGVEVRHAFRQHFIGSAGVSYTSRKLAGIDIDESDLVFNLGTEYFLNRSVVLFGRYEHTLSRSDFADSDYDVDEVRVGVRLRR